MEEKKKKESHDEIIERLDHIIALLKQLAGPQTKDEGPDKPPPNPPGGGG